MFMCIYFEKTLVSRTVVAREKSPLSDCHATLFRSFKAPLASW